MQLNALVVPRAGPFRQGTWNGRELIVVQRRWFPAFVCCLLGALVLGWVGAGVLWPKSDYVPEPDQFRLLKLIGSAFLLVGAVIALWKRSWVADPGAKTITYRSGFVAGRGRSFSSVEGLWLQVHPIKIVVRGALGWSGHATVLHTTETEGVVLAASSSEADARAHTKALAETTRVRTSEFTGEQLSATV